MIGYCGLNCSACDAYRATQENSETKREATAKKWSRMYNTEILPAQIHCNGCKSDGVKFLHCNDCEIRECCVSKSLAHCGDCESYICKALAGFIKLAPEAGATLEKLRSQ